MTDYSDLYQSAGQQYGVDPQLLQAMGSAESSQNPSAENDDTATGQPSVGLMQLQPGTAKEMGVDDATNPKQNINGGAKYYAQQLAKYKDQNLALAAYNWGPKNVDDWLASGADINKLPEETRNHLVRVAGNYQKLKGSSQTTEPVAMTSTQAMDPIEAALSDQGSATPMDPIEAALSEQPTSTQSAKPVDSHGASGDWSKSSNAPQIGALEDTIKSIPSAIVRGVGGIPQIPAYFGNAVAQVGGQAYGIGHDLFSKTPLTEDQQNKLKNIQPFFTGDTFADQLAKTGSALIHGVGGNSLSPKMENALQQVEDKGVTLGDALHQPQTTPGKTISGLLQGMIAGPATGAAMLPSIAGGAGSGFMNAEFPNNPIASAAGGLAGGLTGSIRDAAASGPPINSDVARLAQSMNDDYGIKIPGYQMTNNPLMARIGSTLERLGLTPKNNNADKFNSAIAESIGAPGENNLNPSTMDQARKNNSAGYNAILAKIGDVDASGISTPLANIMGNAQKTLTTNRDSSLGNLHNAINEILERVQPGDKISAADYKKLTDSNSTLEDLSSNPDTAKHARQIENVLHDTLKNSAAPDDVKTLNDLDMKWKNMRTVQGLAAKTDASGQITPASLLTPVAKSFKDMAYKGAGDLGNLATAGKTFKLTNSSGTFENSVAGKILSFLPESLLGSGALLGGHALLGGSGALPATVAAGTYAVGKTTGRALSSDAYRNYLINQSIKHQNNPTIPPNALMGYGAPLAISNAITNQR